MSAGAGGGQAPSHPPTPSSTHSLISGGAENVVNLGYSLYKFCSPICGSTSLNLSLASMDTSCCQSFLCNISAAGRRPLGLAPPCWAWGSCSACWRLCCGLDPDCPAQAPKAQEGRKAQTQEDLKATASDSSPC